MSAGVELIHPGTGRRVSIASRADLNQFCPLCGSEMRGTPIAAVNGAKYDGKMIGWFHLSHLAIVLMAAPATTRRAAEIREEDRVWNAPLSNC